MENRSEETFTGLVVQGAIHSGERIVCVHPRCPPLYCTPLGPIHYCTIIVVGLRYIYRGAYMKYIVLHCALVVVAAYGNVGDRGVAGSRKHVVAMSAVFSELRGKKQNTRDSKNQGRICVF